MPDDHTGEYPRAASYDRDWLLSLDMGPNPLLQTEALLPDLKLEPGQVVLDLGCGAGASSVFLAQECGVKVVAYDLWTDADRISQVVDQAGVRDLVTPIQGDARQLPFDSAEFDAVLSVDAFEYFGTDTRFLPSLLRVVKPGGRIGVSTPGLSIDPYDADPPATVRSLVGWEAAGWHAPHWWQRHWELTGLVTDVRARMQPGSRDHWLEWSRATGEAGAESVRMLEALTGDEIGFVLITAENR